MSDQDYEPPAELWWCGGCGCVVSSDHAPKNHSLMLTRFVSAEAGAAPASADRLEIMAGVMKKLLPPALLAEVLTYLDPLGTFTKELSASAPLVSPQGEE